MTEISIDTRKRSLRVRIDLAGEAEPVDVYIKKYDLKRRGDALVLTIVEARTSRDWITAALREFVVGRRFTIPESVGAALKLLA